jgi:hypothetical protein
MNKRKSFNKTRTLAIIAITFLLISAVLISANFVSPHNVFVQKSVTSSVQVVVVSNSTNLKHEENLLIDYNSYQYLPAINVSFGQIYLFYHSDILNGVYIFSQAQFDRFQAIFPSLQHSNEVTYSASEWANRSGFTYEAASWEEPSLQNGESVRYNVTKTDNYYVVITNGNCGGLTHQSRNIVYYFNEFFDSYSYQTKEVIQTQVIQENDSLYLYVGAVFLVIGLVSISLFRRHQKTVKSS